MGRLWGGAGKALSQEGIAKVKGSRETTRTNKKIAKSEPKVAKLKKLSKLFESP